jgi:methionyl-tRNA formyltransferase
MKEMPRPQQINIVFFGTPELSIKTLKELISAHFNIVAVVTQPASAKHRSNKLVPSPVAKFAASLPTKIFTQAKIDEYLIDSLAILKPNLFVVVAYGNILPKKLLSLPEFGTINLHPSLLPKYRGPSPVQTALLEGEVQTGVSIMLLDEKIDHGPILGQITLPISNLDNAITLNQHLFEQGAILLTNTLLEYVQDAKTAIPQEHSQATFTKLIKKQDGLIDWSKSAELINRQIRAYQPWPGAYSFSQNKIYKFFSSNITEQHNLQPGEVYIKKPDVLIVGTGNKNLQILELQVAGGKQLDSKTFLQGLRDNKLFFTAHPEA